MSKYQSKKEQFTQPQKSKLPMIIAAIALVVTATIIIFLSNLGEKQETINYFDSPVTAERSYLGQLVPMTSMEPVTENGKVQIPLELVDEKNIISFELENNEGVLVPLMAYITPSGRLFVGSSMCEPCGGRTFSLAGETLLCDTCRTTYNIETHEFLSGSTACGQYPPVNMNPTINNGIIEIDLQEILTWRSRV